MRTVWIKFRRFWYALLAFLAIAIAVTAVYIGVVSVPALSPEASAVTAPDPSRPDTAPDASPAPSDAAVETPPVVSPGEFPSFSYSDAVPESSPVENAWFDDAVFLGDSRTDGFHLHSGLTTSHIYGEKSLSVFNAGSEKVIRLEDGSYGTLLDALALRSYKKVYIMLGINELGYRAEAYGAKYAELAEQVRQLQPEATIYIQAIIPVTESRADGDSVYNNENVRAFNEQLAGLCEEMDFYYVDTYSAFANENGALPEELSWDGVHLTPEGYVAWLNYLKTHTITERAQ